MYFIIFLGLFLGSCGYSNVYREKEIKTGLYQVTENKEEGQEKKIERKEIIIKTEPSNIYTKRHKKNYKFDYNNSEIKMDPIKDENETNHSESLYIESKTLSSSFLYGKLSLWTDLTTNFNTNVVTIPKWKHSLLIGGEGIETEIIRLTLNSDEDDSLSFGLRIGSYTKHYENNNIKIQNYFIQENVYTWVTTLCVDVQYHLELPVYFIIGLGTLHYGVYTSINTNLEQYVYEGVEGKRLIGSVNLGVGVI